MHMHRLGTKPISWWPCYTLQWCHNGRDGVSNHQPQHCLLNRLFRSRSKKTSKLRVTGLCAGNSPVTGEFPAQMASNAENVSIWWRRHKITRNFLSYFYSHAKTIPLQSRKLCIQCTCGTLWREQIIINICVDKPICFENVKCVGFQMIHFIIILQVIWAPSSSSVWHQ